MGRMLPHLFILSSAFVWAAHAQADWHEPNCAANRRAIVHLFEWKWTDIANECETFLSQRGYCGVQVSPPNEHAIIGLEEGATEPRCPWWQRYQPVSYILTSRSGTAEQFTDMVQRCNNVGVRIYVDLIANHMTGTGRAGFGSAGSPFDADAGDFPGVPYTIDNFNDCSTCPSCCCINAWQDHDMVRNCRLVGLMDLKQDLEDTRAKTAGYLNNLLDIGVAGFRVDAAKHMWPADLEAIQNALNDVNPAYFPNGGKPFFYHEVIDQNNQGEITVFEYAHIGRVTEFRYCTKIKDTAGALYSIPGLYDPGWGMANPEDAFTFVDNHDNQRGHGGGGQIVTYKDPLKYKMAQAISLSWSYGYPRVMSSYDYGEDTEAGPPSTCLTEACTSCDTFDVTINADGSCGNGWVCEHRWAAIAGMAGFSKATNGEEDLDFTSTGNNAAWRKGNKGFVAMTNEGGMSGTFYTGLPGGDYCNVIQGCATASGCEGEVVTVGDDGMASISITDASNPILAIHAECRSGSNQCVDGGGTAPTTSDPGDTTTQAGTTTSEGATTTSSGATTTPSGTTPPPGALSKTIVYVYMETMPGQDGFIRGGISHDQREGCTEDAETSDCAISMTTKSLGETEHYVKYDAWRDGDTKLDWYGVQVGQGSYEGIPSEGTPLAWTTNDDSNAGYQPDNEWGPNWWKIEADMDCSQAYDSEGWFEVKAFTSNGGGWESDITQGACDGTVGGTPPYSSNNHMIRCGYLNVIEFSSSSCTINSF